MTPTKFVSALGPNARPRRRETRGDSSDPSYAAIHAPSAEAGALACVLTAHSRQEAAFLLDQLEESLFHDHRHTTVFRSLLALQEDGDPLDPVALFQRAKDAGHIEDAGGMEYVLALPDATPSPANFPTYLSTLRDRAARRAMLAECEALRKRALDFSVPVRVERKTAPIPWPELNATVDRSANLLGDRFLERGQGLVLFGPAGSGKSVAGLQAQVFWAAGLPGLHIPPSRPLRIVVLQTEDSIDDVRETLAGIRTDPALTPDRWAMVEQNLAILPALPGGNPERLSALLRAVAGDFKADMVSLNPLLAFCPGDPARELGGILYQIIDPAIKAARVGFMGIHHTPKTNNRDTTGYGSHDWQYLAAGDARVANWPRAMISIEESGFPVYRFRLAKRGHRAGWTDQDNRPITERFFAHCCQGNIRWVDATGEQAAQASCQRQKTALDLLALVPLDAPIPKTTLIQLANTPTNGQPGIGIVKAKGFLDQLLHEGKLHVWLVKRKGTNPMRLISRKPQTAPELETTPT